MTGITGLAIVLGVGVVTAIVVGAITGRELVIAVDDANAEADFTEHCDSALRVANSHRHPSMQAAIDTANARIPTRPFPANVIPFRSQP